MGAKDTGVATGAGDVSVGDAELVAPAADGVLELCEMVADGEDRAMGEEEGLLHAATTSATARTVALICRLERWSLVPVTASAGNPGESRDGGAIRIPHNTGCSVPCS